MQTIMTKYLGPTNSRGPRIKATCWNGTATVSYAYEKETRDNHQAAAEALIAKLSEKADVDWKIIACGHLPDGVGYAFIIE